MKSYYELMKEGIIDFEKVLLDKYYLLGIDETDCLVLLRLYRLSKVNIRFLNISEISKTMSIKEEKLSEVIVNLVNKGFITLSISEDEKYLDEFSIDSTYKELSYVIENNDCESEDHHISLQMKKTVNNLQTRLKKMFTPLEINTIKKWFFDYKYEQSIIDEEIEKLSNKNKLSIAVIDRALFARTKSDITTEDMDKVQGLMKRKYGNH